MKKKVFICFGLCVLFFIHHGGAVSENNNVNFPPELTEIAKVFDFSPVLSWKDAKRIFSKWGRKEGQERWHLAKIELTKEKEEKVLQLLDKLRMREQIPPQYQHYDYAVVLGATVPMMMDRFQHLVNQWKTGVRFKKLIFLLGVRRLSQSDDFVNHMKTWELSKKEAQNIEWTEEKQPMSEDEAARQIYAFARKNIPSDLGSLPVSFVYSPRTWEHDKYVWFRANTKKTVEEWITFNPGKGKALFVSNQPYARYQDLVIRQAMPKDFTVDTIASNISPSTSLAVQLDSLWLWVKNHEET